MRTTVCLALWAALFIVHNARGQDGIIPPDDEIAAWTSMCKIRVAALAMQRSRPNPYPLVRDTNGATIINTSQFDFDQAVGVDAGLVCPIGPSYFLSLRYFWLDESHASAAGDVTGPTAVITTNPPTEFDAGPVAFDYESRLQSGEINLGCRAGNVFLFSGFRWIEVDEFLLGNFRSAAPFTYSVDVNNRLYGFQAGAETTVLTLGDRFRVDAFGKAGILANRAEQNSMVAQPPGTPFTIASARDNVTSLLGETGLLAVYRLSRNWNLHAGYQILWLDGIALASDQAASTGDLSVGGVAPAGVNRSSVLYHGGFVGLELSF